MSSFGEGIRNEFMTTKRRVEGTKLLERTTHRPKEGRNLGSVSLAGENINSKNHHDC
jgi:hypothetical protein